MLSQLIIAAGSGRRHRQAVFDRCSAPSAAGVNAQVPRAIFLTRRPKVITMGNMELSMRCRLNRLIQGLVACAAFFTCCQMVRAQVANADIPLGPWSLFRGNAARNATTQGALPGLDKARWQRPLLLDKWEEFEEEGAGAEAKIWLDKSLGQVKDEPIIPGFFPLVVGDIVIYRSYYDIRGVIINDRKNEKGEIVAKAGYGLWKSVPFNGALAKILEYNKSPTIQRWLPRYAGTPGLKSIFLENTLNGILSTDNRYVYAIDDLAVPAPADELLVQNWNNPARVGQETKPLVLQNILYAFEPSVGRLTWLLGNPRGPFWEQRRDDSIPEHFLSAPLSVNGKLFVLAEKNSGPIGDSQLQLLCIDPLKVVKDRPTISKTTVLSAIKQPSRITHDARRRLNAAHLAYDRGVLVCPTNAGQIFGVDPRNQKIIWTYTYRKLPPFDPKKAAEPPLWSTIHWKASAPILHDGKVVFTAPDDDSVHCLNLADGKFLWKAPPQDDNYLAGILDDKVLLVGKSSSRALSLKDGKEMWTVATGTPSGMGVTNQQNYWLPLKKGAESGQPELCVIDVAHGKIDRRIPVRDGSIPGNLVCVDDCVLSQTATALTVYSRAKQ